MIPLRDENPSASVPFVTRGLIALNAIAFLYELVLGRALRPFLLEWGMVPARMTLALQFGEESLIAPAATFLTSTFLHGGWLHLLGNMWYLAIFGDNVEDRLGKLRFILFYLASGLTAGLFHYLTNPFSNLPTVGASGAVAGVLGAYAITFPGARVITLLPFFPFFFQVVTLPALVVLGLWFGIQFFSGALTISGGGGGVAWWAHVGGFVFGAVVARILRRGARSRMRVE